MHHALLAGMRYTKRFVSELNDYNHTFPNIQGLDLVPGSILTCSGGTWTLRGRLDQRVGDAGLRAKVVAAIDRVRPQEGSEGATTLDIKLKSTGTTVVSSNDGVAVTLPNGMKVNAKVVCSFAEKSDFLFDTTAPAYWYSFSDVESALVLEAAQRGLKNGEYLVTGAGWTKRWIWYASRSQNSVVGFSTTVDVGDIGVGNLADMFVNADVKVTVDSGGSLNGGFENNVAFFSCVRRRVFWPFDDIRATTALHDSETGEITPLSRGGGKEVVVMSDATVDDLELDDD